MFCTAEEIKVALARDFTTPDDNTIAGRGNGGDITGNSSGRIVTNKSKDGSSDSQDLTGPSKSILELSPLGGSGDGGERTHTPPPLSPSQGSPPTEGGVARKEEGKGKREGGVQKRITAKTVAADFGLLTFCRDEGTGEWNYPWDLTGSLYR